MIKYLIVIIISWFIISNIFYNKEGFTENINKRFRPTLRKVKNHKDTFVSNITGQIKRTVRKLNLN